MRSYFLASMFIVIGCGGSHKSSENDMSVADMTAGDDLRAATHDDLAGPIDGGYSYVTDGGATCFEPTPGYYPFANIGIYSANSTNSTANHRTEVDIEFGSATQPTVLTSTVLGCGTFSNPIKQPIGGVPPQNSTVVVESGGTVGVSGGTQPIYVTPDSHDQYTYTNDSLILPAGAQLGVDVGGACDIAAAHFDVAVPNEKLTAPLANDTVSRASDYTVKWTPSNGTVYFQFQAPNNTGVSCAFDATVGDGVISAAIMGTLAAGTANVAVWNYAYYDRTDHGRPYQVFVSSEVTQPDGTRVPFQVTLQ